MAEEEHKLDEEVGEGAGAGNAGGSAGAPLYQEGNQIVPAQRKTLADVVRWQPAIERSTEEKEWVAMDRLMFPEHYEFLSGLFLLRCLFILVRLFLSPSALDFGLGLTACV